MKKQKLAIITSFDELCGNAEYSSALLKEFSGLYDASIIPLDGDVINSSFGDVAIKEIAKQLAEYDLVNIQFEASLFGASNASIVSRFAILAEASKKLIVTMHRVDVLSKSLDLFLMLKHLIRFEIKDCLRNLINPIRANNRGELYKKIVKICTRPNTALIVHTKREKHRVQKLSKNQTKVLDHPLSFLTPAQSAAYRLQANAQDFRKLYSVKKRTISVGLFGFNSPYKGVNIAIKSLEYLPKNYSLLLFGSQHPMQINTWPNGDPYLKSIIESKNIAAEIKSGRIRFLGGLYSHDALIAAMLCCDVVVLPYNECGQSGSGIAALAMDLGVNTVFSQNLAFLELMKYTGPCLHMFSIGNYVELAERIMFADKSKDFYTKEEKTLLKAYSSKYNLSTNVRLYHDAFNNL